jgi:Family of unknown function (DUF6314)
MRSVSVAVLGTGPGEPARAPLSRRIFALLHGGWAIERRITPGGRFTGTATFTPRSADSLLYRESGRLVLHNGTELLGEKSYLYALRPGGIEISFNDGLSKGAHFIDIFLPYDRPDAFPIASSDRHRCRLDTYDATFRMENPALFTLTYVVNGPTKAYVSRSVYRRSK